MAKWRSRLRLALWVRLSQLLVPNVLKHAAGKEKMHRHIGSGIFHPSLSFDITGNFIFGVGCAGQDKVGDVVLCNFRSMSAARMCDLQQRTF